MTSLVVAWLFAIGSAFFFVGCLMNLWMAHYGQ